MSPGAALGPEAAYWRDRALAAETGRDGRINLAAGLLRMQAASLEDKARELREIADGLERAS